MFGGRVGGKTGLVICLAGFYGEMMVSEGSGGGSDSDSESRTTAAAKQLVSGLPLGCPGEPNTRLEVVRSCPQRRAPLASRPGAFARVYPLDDTWAPATAGIPGISLVAAGRCSLSRLCPTYLESTCSPQPCRGPHWFLAARGYRDCPHAVLFSAKHRWHLASPVQI